jgi:hypothetical protein
VAIIASILAILFVIAAEVYPLLKKPTATLVGTIAASTGSPRLRWESMNTARSPTW